MYEAVEASLNEILKDSGYSHFIKVNTKKSDKGFLSFGIKIIKDDMPNMSKIINIIVSEEYKTDMVTVTILEGIKQAPVVLYNTTAYNDEITEKITPYLKKIISKSMQLIETNISYANEKIYV